MSLQVTVDTGNWLNLPAGFPSDDAPTADAWIEQTVERMREHWSGGLDAETEGRVRDELRSGLDAVRPEDALTLQYWRWSAPLAAVVHLVLGSFDDAGERPAYLLDEDAAYAADPAFEIVTAEGLGDGVEVRVLTRPEGLDDDIAGLTQLYSSGDLFVAVGVDATLPPLLAVMLPDLRELLDSAVVVDDEGLGPWVRSTVDENVVPARGETWTDRVAPIAPPA